MADFEIYSPNGRLVVFEMFPDAPYEIFAHSRWVPETDRAIATSEMPVLKLIAQKRFPQPLDPLQKSVPHGFIVLDSADSPKVQDAIARLPDIFKNLIVPGLTQALANPINEFTPRDTLDRKMVDYTKRAIALLDTPEQNDRFMRMLFYALPRHSDMSIANTAISLLNVFGPKRGNTLEALARLASSGMHRGPGGYGVAPLLDPLDVAGVSNLYPNIAPQPAQVGDAFVEDRFMQVG